MKVDTLSQIINWIFGLQDETPLFLAAREGSYQTAKILLDHLANRDITDQMERLPKDIALEKFHTDIVKLLDEYRVVENIGAYATSPHLMQYMPQKPAKKPRQRKTNAMKEAEALSPHHQPNKVHLPPVKKTRKKKGAPATSTSPKADAIDLPPSYESATGLLGVASGVHDMNHMSHSLQDLQQDMASVNNLQTSWMDHHNMLQQQQMMPAISSPSSSPLGTGSSSSSPLCRLATSPQVSSEHSPAASGSMGPSPLSNPVHSPHHQMALSPKKSLPLSPTHMQALQQQTMHRAQASPSNYYTQNLNQDYSVDYNAVIGVQPLGYLGEQYPTPPSQHSLSDSTPQHMAYFPGGETTLLTPSPESADGWSSSSPQSAHSGEWSDGIASPPQTRPQPNYHMPKQNSAYL